MDLKTFTILMVVVVVTHIWSLVERSRERERLSLVLTAVAYVLLLSAILFGLFSR